MTTPLSGQAEAPEPPRGHVRIVYLGPVAPHWEIESEFGERPVIEAFRERALARLVLLHPTTRSSGATGNASVRDAERENLLLEWDLGIPEEPARHRVLRRVRLARAGSARQVHPRDPEPWGVDLGRGSGGSPRLSTAWRARRRHPAR